MDHLSPPEQLKAKAASEGSLVCNVCKIPVDLSNPFCGKCGSRRVQEAVDAAVPGIAVRKASVVQTTDEVRSFLKASGGSGGSPSPAVSTSPVNTHSRSLSDNPASRGYFGGKSFRLQHEQSIASIVTPAAATSGPSNADLYKMILATQASVASLQEQLLSETRARFKVEQLLRRVMEDTLKLRGVALTDEAIEKQVSVLTNFLDTLAPKWKIDFDEIDFGDQIATGGFSEVYGGVYKDEKVAIKKLRVDVLQGEDYLVELEQEVKLHCELDHPNILKFVGVCLWPSYYILTELMETTWDQVLHSKEPLTPEIKKDVLLQVCRGVTYLHYLDPAVLHLDIKPLNTLVSRQEGPYYLAKLSDFGLSCRKKLIVRTSVAEYKLGFRAFNAVSESGSLPTFLPGRSVPVGTPLHIAPEMIHGKPFNEKVDIFAFGMFMFETLTRERLRSLAEGRTELFYPTIPQGTNEKLKQLILSCWKENPWERPSIMDVAKRLLDSEVE